MTQQNQTLFSLAGKLILITGAARGNGEAVARGVAALGAKVIVVDIDGEGAANTASSIRTSGGEAWGFALDVSDRAACEGFAEMVAAEIGEIDVLVNNAGLLKRVPFASAEACDALSVRSQLGDCLKPVAALMSLQVG